MLADVPLGAFLSGGVDSSLIAALLQEQSSARIQTFTIGFIESNFNEAPAARKIAQHLGCEHREQILTAHEALSVIPSLPFLFDEPFADATQIPAYLLAKMARRHVSVALSGDGGDELFGGYPRYRQCNNLWSFLRCIPMSLRARCGKFGSFIGAERWQKIGQLLESISGNAKFKRFGHRIDRVSDLLGATSFDQLYLLLSSHWLDPNALVKGAVEPISPIRDRANWLKSAERLRQLMLVDLSGYLPGDILATLDRAAMAVSLETRTPLLDHRIIEFSYSLPLNYLFEKHSGKRILKRVLAKFVPLELFDRPKSGFSVPIGEWLRTDLRDWGENLLSHQRLEHDGFLNPAPIRHAWSQHLKGIRNYEGSIWGVLMFNSWLEAWKSRAVVESTSACVGM